MEDVYLPADMSRLEAKCSKLILDCIDWEKEDESKDTLHDIGNLYDLLYQMYCAKFTPDGIKKRDVDSMRAFVD